MRVMDIRLRNRSAVRWSCGLLVEAPRRSPRKRNSGAVFTSDGLLCFTRLYEEEVDRRLLMTLQIWPKFTWFELIPRPYRRACTVHSARPEEIT